MNYEFPEIKNIKDVLWAVEDSPEFIVAERDGYTIINYAVNMPDTFPPINVAGDSAKNRLRRECRGIAFCSETGVILRRPYHKFFNVGEREETQFDKIDLSQPHVILDKIDGSFIVPFIVRDEMIWGTKMADEKFGARVKAFVIKNPNYHTFAWGAIKNGYSPIFEWCSRSSKIVIDHPEDTLVLTGVRIMETGDYVDHWTEAAMYGIPTVEMFQPETDIEAFVARARELENVEGYVIRFNDGHMFKVKCDWYVAIHKAKEKILFDRHIVNMIFEGELDDIKPHVPEDVERLENFERMIDSKLNEKSMYLCEQVTYWYDISKGDRKTFALEHADKTGWWKSHIFALWGHESSLTTAREMLIRAVKNNLGSNVKYDFIRDIVFDGEKYNEY